VTDGGVPGRPLLGVNTFVWYSPLSDAALAEIAPRVAEWGFDAIELPLEGYNDFDPATAQELLSRLGLRPVVCVVMPPGRELVAADAGVVDETQRYLRHCIDVAVTIGADRVVGPMYASVGRTWRATAEDRGRIMAELQEVLRPLAEYAGEREVLLGLEPLNRYETSVLTTVEQALDVIGPLPSSIGLAPDTYHMNIEEKDLPATLRTVGDRLVHLQVCGNDRGAPGYDHIDWEGIRSVLIDLRYDGVLGIESFTSENETIATAASIWRPLAPTQDDLALQGLAFLRRWSAGWPTAPGAGP